MRAQVAVMGPRLLQEESKGDDQSTQSLNKYLAVLGMIALCLVILYILIMLKKQLTKKKDEANKEEETV